MKKDTARTLRETAGQIRSVNDLRRVATILAQHFNLPHAPTIEVGYVPWQGPSTPLIDLVSVPYGHFRIARWAVRGKYRRSPETLE
jgi:hypothetical protein